jgi:hypothetical protein
MRDEEEEDIELDIVPMKMIGNAFVFAYSETAEMSCAFPTTSTAWNVCPSEWSISIALLHREKYMRIKQTDRHTHTHTERETERERYLQYSSGCRPPYPRV